MGGLTGIRTVAYESLTAGKIGRELKLESASAADPGIEVLETNRANKYATPTHRARTTKAYSVSVPV